MSVTKLTEWDCQIESDAKITVGSKFDIQCNGPSIPFNSEKVLIYAKEPDAQTQSNSLNNLKIIALKSIDQTSIKATVTSYLTGNYDQNDFFVLTDGKSEVALQNLKFSVASVLQQNQENKPYPAYPPWVMPIPLWLIVLIVLLFIGPLIGIIIIFRRQRQRRTLFESLKKMKTARPAFDEFHREVRLLEKKHGIEPADPKAYVQELEKVFRMYLVRELVVPAQTWSDRAILNEIKVRHKMIWEDSERELKRLLKEFHRAERSKVSVGDCRQLYLMSLDASERIFNVILKKSRRGSL